MFIIRIAIAVFLFLSSSAYAFDIEISPKDLAPGDVFSLKIKGIEHTALSAEFKGAKIDLHADDTGFISLVSVSLDTEPGEYGVVVRHGEEERTLPVKVKEYDFRTIHLTLPEGKVTPNAKNLKRIKRESKLLGEAWSHDTSMEWEGGFVSPTGTEVSTEFGLNRIMNKKRNSRHRGTDFRGKTGTPIKAINSGTVVLTGDYFFGGNTLVVDHGMGLYSIYMHLSKFNVSRGDKVSKEQVVGLVGSTGRATGPHLHMSVKLKGVSVNPESLFRLRL